MAVSPSPRSRNILLAERYSLREKLGSGSMGTVYLANDEHLGKLVALKILRAERFTVETKARMQAEFRTVASLRHPQIAQAYDFGYAETGGLPFYTREYIPGSPLAAGPPRGADPVEFLRPILDVLDALEYIHGHGILHLDIHAGNVIAAKGGKRGAVLIDLGLVRSAALPTFSLSSGGWPILPPEMIEGRGLSARTDLFLAGRLLFYRLTGLSQGKPALPREIPGWGTRRTLELERIVSKSLARAPKDRFASAAELRSALIKAVGGDARPRLEGTEPASLLVGRAKEIERIDGVLEAAAGGQARILAFVAKPGLGKSRLLAEARLRAQIRGLRVVEATFREHTGPEPALLHALRATERRRPGELDWLSLLSPTFGGTPEERARRVADAYFAEEASPLAILADDADHADHESRLLLEALANACALRTGSQTRGRGLAIILSGSETPPIGMPVGRKGKAWLHVLEPLARSDAVRLLRSLLPSLDVPANVARRAVSAAKRSPLALRSVAAALHESWSHARAVPAGAEVPAVSDTSRTKRFKWTRLQPIEREIIDVLAIARRALTRAEIRAVVHRRPGEIDRSLRRLARLEVVTSLEIGTARRYQTSFVGTSHEASLQRRKRHAALVHERLARHLEDGINVGERSGVRLENLAYHLLACARYEDGIAAAREGARLLKEKGSFDRAIRLLREAGAASLDLKIRLVLAEEMTSILEETGDHAKAVEALLPFRHLPPAQAAMLQRGEAVRLRRRLGISYHRAGRPGDALEVFEEAQRLADPALDAEDLTFMDSERAEIYIFQGAYEEAETACRRGLARLEGVVEPFRVRMATMLRASLGHIALRRLSLEEARAELRSALELSRDLGNLGDRAAILHNLAVTENHLGNFKSARQLFARTERLLRKTGEYANLVKVSTNLALIEAKLGRKDAAKAHLGRAAELLRHHTSQRLECFLAYSRGVVEHCFAETDAAVASFKIAMALCVQLGDAALEAFAMAYTGETLILSGRYADAWTILTRLLPRTAEGTTAILRRTVLSRLVLLATLLSRWHRAKKLQKALDATPRTDVVLLEAWNDVFLGLALLIQRRGVRLSTSSEETFRNLGMPMAQSFARLTRLVGALAAGDEPTVRGILRRMARAPEKENRFLRVAEPLAAADAFLRFGSQEEAEQMLGRAQGAIVGEPYLELDWMLEATRAALCWKRRDLREARRHLHRALHSRDLLLQFIPARSRTSFLAHPRFDALREMESRLRRSSHLQVTAGRVRWPQPFEGMIGRSKPMEAIFETIERLKQQESPILITGETGSGKELVARAILRLGSRREKSFQTIHCACLPPELFEAELFGHTAGAFTGADRDHSGLLESADGGTILLDEVGHLPLDSQAKLLRFLDSGVIRRLGSTTARRIDVWLLATSSDDLSRSVEEKRFRADLYYRLAGFEIRVPRLKERTEDIPLLARHFLEKHASRLDRTVPTIDEGALQALTRRDWPGNVRELEMVLLRAMVHSPDAARLSADDLAPLFAGAPAAQVERKHLLDRGLDDWRSELEREYLTQLFLKTRGDLRAVMQTLGVKQTKLYAWLRDLGLGVRKLRKNLDTEE